LAESKYSSSKKTDKDQHICFIIKDTVTVIANNFT